MIGLLHRSQLAATGRGVRIAVIDSGVHAAHPHVQGVAGGVGVDPAGATRPDYTDRLGHGTAVTAAIREKASDADIYAIKVFDRELATTGEALVAAIACAIEWQAHLVNLSLGTTNPAHEEALAAAVRAARKNGIFIVAAAPQPGMRWLPGAFAEVIRVDVDWTLPRDSVAVEISDDGGDTQIRASGYPRPIPGVSRERNLKGVSFAVANATGLLACALEGHAPPRNLATLLWQWLE